MLALMRFAQAAAHRLHRLSDPEVIAGRLEHTPPFAEAEYSSRVFHL